MYLTKTFDINGGFGKYRSSHQIMSKQIRKLEVLLILLVSTVTLPAQVSTDDSTSQAKDFALKLISTKSKEERNALLLANKALVTQQLAEAFIVEGNRLYGTVPFRDVLDVFLLGLQVAEMIQDKSQIVKALNSVANIRSRLGEPKVAYEMYKRALDLAERIGDKAMTAKLLSNLAEVSQLPFKERLSLYLRALGLAKETGDKKTSATILTRIGNNYTKRGDLQQALRYHEEALDLRRKMGDKSGISGSLSNIGIILENQGRLTEAVANFRESIRLSREIVDKEGEMIDLYNLGNCFKELGDLTNALELFVESIELGKKLGMFRDTAGAEFNLASLYEYQGSWDLAEGIYKKLLTTFENSNDTYGLKLTLSDLAKLNQKKGNLKESIRLLKYALEISTKEENELDMAVKLRELGDTYTLLGDTVEASEHFGKALRISEKLSSPREVIMIKQSMGRFKLNGGHADEAISILSEIKESIGKTRHSDQREFYTLLGQAALGSGDTATASSSFIKAISILESERSGAAANYAYEFFRDKLAPYHSYIELLVQTKDLESAFEYAERSRSRLLVELIQSGRQSDRHLPDQDARKESELRARLVSLNKQLAAEGSNDVDGDELRRNVDATRRELEDFENRLRAAHPELRIARGELKPLNVPEAMELLNGPSTAFVEYLVTDEKTFVFVITRTSASKPLLNVFTVKMSRKDLSDKVNHFRESISAGDLDFSRDGRELYDLLLGPATAMLAGKTNLLIVPDGSLWDLPFQALQAQNGRYLLESTAVSYEPSLTALREMRKKASIRKPSPDAELIAFGNPTVGKETKERVQRVFMGEKLEPLPEAERLVNELVKMYGATRSKVFIGANALEETAKSESPKYRIVQFATHGILNNVSPMYSHLVFAQNNKNPNEDGLLEAWEMKDLDLNADMVILSACDTARGKIANGEGMIGMTWASFIAGAPTTVASQWKVESSSTTELMLEFHRQLLTGKVSKAEAMRRASLKLMKLAKYRHPSYWAGFVVVGDGS